MTEWEPGESGGPAVVSSGLRTPATATPPNTPEAAICPLTTTAGGDRLPTGARSPGYSGPGVPAPSLGSSLLASIARQPSGYKPRVTPGSARPYRLSPPRRSTIVFPPLLRRLNWRRS